ncbi:pyruvate kinase [Bacteroidales bacterium OttesenSCG-928-I21]|nr:pyruvate kinase [Bacteroidales bacterium OttesenSCG-928-I21]
MDFGSKTKIIATLGPSSNSHDTLKSMILSGLNVFRLNFSHGTHEEKEFSIKIIRELEKELNTNIAILADLQGPKIRIGKIANEPKILLDGNEIFFTSNIDFANENTFYISYQNFANDVKKDDEILVDDGKIKLRVTNVNKREQIVSAIVIYGGALYSNKGVNLPNTRTSLPSLTEKDKKDVIFAIDNNIKWIALSFVRKADDIVSLQNYISEQNKKINIIAKIEKPEAVENIDEIIKVSDGIMVARGDLGVEMNFNKVPVIQKMIVEKCIYNSKPVIIATQMIESMMKSFSPTRAEANDIANSVDDGADALMLSGETSVGDHPALTVRAMQSIIDYTEANRNIYYKNHSPDPNSLDFLPDSLCYNACLMAQQTGAKAIIPFTYSGYTAVELSSQRPKADIFVFTGNCEILDKLPLLWGISAYYFPIFDSIDKAIEYSLEVLLKEKKIRKGDLVIHIASTPLRAKDRTNMIKLSRV